MHIPKRAYDRLVVARFLRGNDVGERQDEVAAGNEDVVREWLCVSERDRVVDKLDGLSPPILVTSAWIAAAESVRSMTCVAPSDLRKASWRREAVAMMGKKPESFVT